MNKKTQECSACGAAAETVRGDYRYAESGLKNVILRGVELIRCQSCGNEAPVIARMSDLHRALALAVASQPFRLQGEDVRFLRKYLGMTQDAFASLLHIHKSNLSKWENNEDRIGEQSDRLIRAVVLTLGAGLQRKAAEVVRAFPQIKPSSRKRLEVDAGEDYTAKVA
jgi:putative zinc finger/helix-turn-helix YgiT family protein